MAEKLGEIGDVLSGISKAVKTMKLLQDDRTELYRVIKETEQHASEVDQLDLADEPLLKELKLQLVEVRSSGSELDLKLPRRHPEKDLFDHFQQGFFVSNEFTREAKREFCEKVQQSIWSLRDLREALGRFNDGLNDSHRLAKKLCERLTQKAEELKRQKHQTRIRGAAGAAGLAVGGAGLAAVSLLTGGVALLAAAAAAAAASAGATAGVAAGAVAATTVANAKTKQQQATDMRECSIKLAVITRNIQSILDKAGRIRLDEDIEALQTLLELLSRDESPDESGGEASGAGFLLLDQDGRIARRQQEQRDAMDARIAELEAKMRMHGIK